MLTAGEIATKKFDKSIGGYRVEEVDSFLKQISDDYGKLFQEKDDLEHKLEVLAEKLIEYREDEESLRTALLGAQKLGDSVIRESRTKAEIILRDATIKAERLVENAQKQIEHERIGLINLQNEVAGFKNRLLNLYKQHLELVSALPGEIDEEQPVGNTPDSDVQEPLGDTAGESGSEPIDVNLPGDGPADDLESMTDPIGLGDDELLPFEALPEIDLSEGDLDTGDSLDSVFLEEDDRPRESKFGALKFGEGFDLQHDDEGKKRR